MSFTDGHFTQSDTNIKDLTKNAEVRRLNMVLKGIGNLMSGSCPNDTYNKIKARLYTYGVDVPAFNWDSIDYTEEPQGEIEFEATLFAGTSVEQNGDIVDSDLFERKTGDRLVFVVAWSVMPNSGIDITATFTTESEIAPMSLDMNEEKDEDDKTEEEEKDENMDKDKKKSKKSDPSKEDEDEDKLEESVKLTREEKLAALQEKYGDFDEAVMSRTFSSDEEKKNFEDSDNVVQQNAQEAIDAFNKKIDKRFAPYINASVQSNIGSFGRVDLVGAGKDSKGTVASNSLMLSMVTHGEDAKFKVLQGRHVKHIGLKFPVARKQKSFAMAGTKLADWFNKNADELLDYIESKYNK